MILAKGWGRQRERESDSADYGVCYADVSGS